MRPDAVVGLPALRGESPDYEALCLLSADQVRRHHVSGARPLTIFPPENALTSFTSSGLITLRLEVCETRRDDAFATLDIRLLSIPT